VTLEPLPVENTIVKGIFTYTVNFPAAATAALTFGNEALVTLTSKDFGYYNLLFITLTKGALSAGLSEKVHIYAGLESEAVFAFDEDDFVDSVYLAGTLSLPGSVAISNGTISVYSDAAYNAQIGESIFATASGLMEIPGSSAGAAVYLKAVISGNDGKTYVPTANIASLTEKGIWDIILSDTTAPGKVSGLIKTTPGSGNVTLSWTDSDDADLDHIEISRTPGDGAVNVAKGTRAYTAVGLTNGTAYTFTVKVVDTAENKSAGETVMATPVAPVNDFDLTDLVTVPVKDRTPNTTAINRAQYTGTIAWQTGNGVSLNGDFAALGDRYWSQVLKREPPEEAERWIGRRWRRRLKREYCLPGRAHPLGTDPNGRNPFFAPNPCPIPASARLATRTRPKTSRKHRYKHPPQRRQ
jgi:hypothetical protein